MHAIANPSANDTVNPGPVGIGVATPIDHLHHSFGTAMVALQLCDPPTKPTFLAADDYCCLIWLIADAGSDTHHPGADLLDKLGTNSWAATTLDAFCDQARSGKPPGWPVCTNSTMQAMVESITETIGGDPFDGLGRTRLGIAYLVWRLRHSRVLDLTAPSYG